MESKTKTADVSVRAAFSLVQGALLAMSYPLCYFMLPELVRTSYGLFLFVVFPALAFLISLGMNWFLQYLYCGSVNISKIATASVITPVTTLSLTALTFFVPFLKSPIVQLFPESPQESLEEATFVKDMYGQAFYLFWAGVYGQTIGSGMISACPKA